MKIFIHNKKINYNNIGKSFVVEDDFFEKYPNKISDYDFIEDNGKIVGLYNSKNIEIIDEKQKLFSEYKSNLDQIKELNAEIQEVEATAEYFPEVAEKRIDKLTKDRTELRTRNGQIIAEAIEKFGEEVVNEF